MTLTQFCVMAIEALLATAPAVLLIPRARQSPMFDRVLWLATWALAFLGAWNAPTYFAADSALNDLMIVDVAIVPTILGALVGALSINVLLWLLDRFGGQVIEEEVVAEPVTEETHNGENPNTAEQ